MDYVIGLMVILVYFLILGIGLISYVLSSLAYYKIAKRRNIENAWLAWIPFGNSWIMGRVANEYDNRNGYNRKWHIALLTLAIIATVLMTVFYIMFFISIMMGLTYGADVEEATELLLGSYVGIAFGAVAALAYSVLSGICVYKTFESTRPEKALLYTILYYLIPLAGPICLVNCMDKGYDYTEEVIPADPVPAPVEVVATPAEEVKDEPAEETAE